jgi:hypothetical protein
MSNRQKEPLPNTQGVKRVRSKMDNKEVEIMQRIVRMDVLYGVYELVWGNTECPTVD